MIKKKSLTREEKIGEREREGQERDNGQTLLMVCEDMRGRERESQGVTLKRISLPPKKGQKNSFGAAKKEEKMSDSKKKTQR